MALPTAVYYREYERDLQHKLVAVMPLSYFKSSNNFVTIRPPWNFVKGLKKMDSVTVSEGQ